MRIKVIILTARQLGTLITDLSFIGIRKRHNEVMSIGHSRGSFNLLLCGVRLAILDVSCDRRRKQRWFLPNISNQRTEMRNVDVLEIDSVKLDASRIRVVESFYQCNGSRLTAATMRLK
jgi:hypothetical protein